MTRCPLETQRARSEAKPRELSREEQVGQLPITEAELVREVGPTLFRLAHPDALIELVLRYGPRMSRNQFAIFVATMEDGYGTAFCRRAGLPVGQAKLSLAS
jgi:hypothetical protein